MRSHAFVLLIGLLFGGGAGFVLGIFVYPFLFLNDIVATEAAPDAAAGPLLARGQFIHANPSDPLHYGKGGVRVYRDVLHLEADFEVGPGPKYHVYLVPLDEVTPDTEVEETMYVDLGRLKAFKGSQNYPIPAGVDIGKYPHVVIWCEQFNVLISPARLEPGG
ncbi:MAG TPA: DM13 domain-containing protein [Burkholderiales bacterium]